MNAEEALTLTRIVRAAFPAQRFDEFTIDVWAAALEDADFGECRAAVVRLSRVQTFASVAEVIAEAKAHRRDGMRRALNQQTLAAIEGAKRQHDPEVSHQAYLDARAAFDAAVAAARARRGEAEETTDESAAHSRVSA